MEENKVLEPKDLAVEILNILYSKKGHNIKMLHVTDQTVITDYFVICTGNSNTQIKALADEVDYKTGLMGIKPKSIEGFREATWIVMDYSSVIVHIFNRESREFYNLEKLWNDSEVIDVDQYIRKEEDDTNE
ncbi:MAG: ribosome silencing factor [Clostridia bacterium]|nr:ribosome silencing factor [Clostridia bacterium]